MPFYAQTDLDLELFGLEVFAATQSWALDKSQSALWRTRSSENQTLTSLEICDSMPLEIITLGQTRRCVDNQMEIFNEEEARVTTSYGWRVPSNYSLYSGGSSSSPVTEPRALAPRARLSPKQASFVLGSRSTYLTQEYKVQTWHCWILETMFIQRHRYPPHLTFGNVSIHRNMLLHASICTSHERWTMHTSCSFNNTPGFI
ncbi:uncharacterized protein EV420DRAFT_145853 [Desarmillaria tabescens]|uniref:Uncharacterized protein n=1 Tax=Armillaria tabescens TaxID=1929756 RepID=A0AA39NAK7_ARMTA|nr:uncharacterized protein EV420DRAFT_145853 [Desarmillaria tabescens]KAK0462069.1 hypothetical protein EV420DRAFT_145853 [Desarmillaria tabescens]